MTKIVCLDEAYNEIVKDVEIEERLNLDYVQSHNAPVFVQFGNKYGFLKNSEASTRTLDKFEFIITILGKKLGIDVANTFLVLDEAGNINKIISESVLKDNEKLIEFSKKEKEEFVDFNNIEVQNIVKYYELLKTKDPNEFTDEEKGFIIEAIPNIMINSLENGQEISNDFYRMLFFDLITGNLDRNPNNFAFIQDELGNIRLSPLFDNSTIDMPNTDNSLRMVHTFLLPAKDIFNYLVENHYDAIEDIISTLNEENIIEFLETLADKYLEEKEANWLISRIGSNINGINMLLNENNKTL